MITFIFKYFNIIEYRTKKKLKFFFYNNTLKLLFLNKKNKIIIKNYILYILILIFYN